MREVNAHGAAGGGVWLRSSVCVRAIGTRCRRGLNRQRSEVKNFGDSHAWVCKGCGRTDIIIFTIIEPVLQTKSFRLDETAESDLLTNEEEDRRGSYKWRQTSGNFARGG